MINIFPVPVPGTSAHISVTDAAAKFSTVMAAGEAWLFTASIDCYIKQGTSDVTASAADGSTLVAAGAGVVIEGALGAYLSALRVGSTSGVATLTQVGLTAIR